MIFNSIDNARRWRAAALLSAMLCALASGGVSAQAGRDAGGQCWKPPAAETIEEIFKTSGNRGARRKQAEPANAVLLISNGSLQVAYSAGLLVGWAETGDRPRFAAITAVGTSALIAPFLFIGPDGDQAVADIFNCDARNFGQIAERAASFLDRTVLDAIAREHDAGRRLFIALPGSAARDETVWNMGLLAKSRHPRALTLAQDILRASILLHTPVVPEDGQNAFMQTAPTNLAFRDPGAGQAFLLPPEIAPVAGAGTRFFLIHNDRLFWDDSAEYISRGNGKSSADAPSPSLIPGSEIVQRALAAKGSFRFASPKTASGLMPGGEFDLTYLRGLFRYAYRQGRMDKEWGREFPGVKLGPSGF
jgi:hypothetical protein